MKQKGKLAVLLVLVVVLVAVNLGRKQNAPASRAASSPAQGKKQEKRIPDLELRLGLLEEAGRRAQVGRNIFQYQVREVTRPKPAQTTVVAPPAPVVEPAPPAPFRFYGFAEDSQGGRRRVFLTNGEEIFIASEGETLLRRYRVARVRATSIELEDVIAKRQWVLPLEQP